MLWPATCRTVRARATSPGWRRTCGATATAGCAGTGTPPSSRDRATSQSSLEEPGLDAAARCLTMPTLLVRGRLSTLVTEEEAEHFLGLVPHARLVDVSNAGHMVAGDRNDVFTRAILAFLAEAFGPVAA